MPDLQPSTITPKPGTEESGTRMKTTNVRRLWAILTVGVLANLVQADILELKNGTLLNGTFAGGSTGTVPVSNCGGPASH